MAEEKFSKLEARYEKKNYLECRPERQRHGKCERDIKERENLIVLIQSSRIKQKNREEGIFKETMAAMFPKLWKT